MRPYSVGLVIDPGEKVWAEVPVLFNLDRTMPPSGPGRPIGTAIPTLVRYVRPSSRPTLR